jgi:phage terminase large subunit-like protein
MQEIEDYWKKKDQCIADLEDALPRLKPQLDDIDPRLSAYIEDALSNHASHANFFELLGIRKVMRLMVSYKMDGDRVQRTLRAIEGQWRNGRHVKGGLKFSTPRGPQHVRLMPYQVWCVFGIYGFKTDVCMERRYTDGDELLPTEWVNPDDGMVWDTRRLTEEAHIFQTRKSGKTEFGAAIDFVEACFLGPVNSQVLICAPSSEQSKIAYKAIREFAMQIDPTCTNRMGGRFFRMTRNGLNWQPGHKMKGEIKTMAAGKTSKDGLYASVVHPDEHGQVGYINGSCDMQNAVETCWGSTGPRREKLLMHTTTAGRVKEGPYKDQLGRVEENLLSELDYPLDQPHRTDDDVWFAFLLQLDKPEITDDLEKLDNTELFKKCNRSIGVTVQPDYYRKRLHEASTSDDTKKEVLTKDFNIFQSDRFMKWLSGDQIRPRQTERRITDCWATQGWRVFCGLDFGGSDDLWAACYLAVNYQQQQPEGRFFADMDLWITEAALHDSPNRPLYEMWIRDGWLHVCPGEVFSHEMAINKIMERAGYDEHGNLMATPDSQIDMRMFGYDPAQSTAPINQLKAWLQSLFQQRGMGGADIAQTLKQMVVPVPQTFVAQNGLVQEIEYMLLTDHPWLHLSANPAWPWMFQNVKLEISPNELKKPLKSGTHNKIDGVHALLDALYCFDLSEGLIQV